jgi:hypothetical protein
MAAGAFQEIERCDRVDLEVVERSVLGKVVRGLGGAMDDQVRARSVPRPYSGGTLSEDTSGFCPPGPGPPRRRSRRRGMPRHPRRPDAEALRQARDQDLAAGGLRRVFPLTLEEWVARAPRDVLAGVIRALLDAFPKRRRTVFEERLRTVMVRGFPEERVPPASRKITPSLLAESVATPPATGARGWAYQLMRHGIRRGHACHPLTLLTHKRVVLEWLAALPRSGRNPNARRLAIRKQAPALMKDLDLVVKRCTCGAVSTERPAFPETLKPFPGEACRQILGWYHGRDPFGLADP